MTKNEGSSILLERLSATLASYTDADCEIMLYENEAGTEVQLLKHVTGYITGRSPQNVNCVETAYALNVPCYSGFSNPIF